MAEILKQNKFRQPKIWIPVIVLGIIGVCTSLGISSKWPQIASSISLIFVGYMSISMLTLVKPNDRSKFNELCYGMCLIAIVALANISVWTSSYKWIYSIEAGLFVLVVVTMIFNYKKIRNLNIVKQGFFNKEVIIFLLISIIFMTTMNVLYFEKLYFASICVGVGFFMVCLYFL